MQTLSRSSARKRCASNRPTRSSGLPTTLRKRTGESKSDRRRRMKRCGGRQKRQQNCERCKRRLLTKWQRLTRFALSARRRITSARGARKRRNRATRNRVCSRTSWLRATSRVRCRRKSRQRRHRQRRCSSSAFSRCRRLPPLQKTTANLLTNNGASPTMRISASRLPTPKKGASATDRIFWKRGRRSGLPRRSRPRGLMPSSCASWLNCSVQVCPRSTFPN
mmetsp:Transcript_75674/g.122882  ORF Transcript_75674/g.122882 Transcript_75674/m.122882 type:complete len:222 (-) Transcript_75674:146-811(-)